MSRNLEGKSLFRVLIKQTTEQSKAKSPIAEEILWKVFELVFAVAFFNRSDSNIFKMALDGLDTNTFNENQTGTTGIFEL